VTTRATAGPRVVVVGGGIAGLTAAFRLTGHPARPQVLLLEGSDQLGGKLRCGEVAGVALDVGAEAMLARRPEALDLATAVGLGSELTSPATVTAGVRARGDLRPFPARMVQGVPGDLEAVRSTGVLDDAELASLQPLRQAPGDVIDGDVSVGGYLRPRVGSPIVDRLVEPLLAGVYAGRVDELSMRAVLPQFGAALEGRNVWAVAAEAAARPSADGPVFAGLPGGVSRLATAVAAAARGLGAHLRTGAMVRDLRVVEAQEQESRSGRTAFELTVGPARAPETVVADCVLIACPAVPAGRLLAGVAPDAARALADIPYASMAVVTLAVRSSSALPGSGFLVAAGELPVIKAATFSASKWPWLAERQPDGVVLLRASVGRFGDEHLLQREDTELVRLAVTDLDRVLVDAGLHPLGAVVDSAVTRWGGALPQYQVGHVDRVARIRASIATVPGLAVAGAPYEGIGIPACIASADRAVTDLSDRLPAA
jgi:oxygen-dependent protoporphyrinogen oxidase